MSLRLATALGGIICTVTGKFVIHALFSICMTSSLNFFKASKPVYPSLSQIITEDKTKTITVKDLRGSVKTQVKHVHFLRHAQGLHNVAGEANYLNYMKKEFTDSPLSEEGIKQCKLLCVRCEKTSQYDSNIDLLVVSPLLRTLQTASFSFPFLISKIPWLALDEIREQTGLHPCDKRIPVSLRSKEFAYVDFKNVVHDEDLLYFKYIVSREPANDVARRGGEFMDWLSSRDEENVLVVTHSAFLTHFFDQVVTCDEYDKVKFENCELRSYNLVLPDNRGSTSPGI